MNTNDQQFLKAYNDLITAFFNFMNVVSPNNNSQPNLSYIASQLNQILNYLETKKQGETPNPVPSPNPVLTSEPISNPIPSPEPFSNPEPIPNSGHNSDTPLSNPVIKYCAYPELVNGQYKFKSSALLDNDGDASNDQVEIKIYKLTIDEETKNGYVELAQLNSDQVMIITNNPTLYTPQDICVGANNITPGKVSISSSSKLHLVKVLRGWAIAEGEKFILNVS